MTNLSTETKSGLAYRRLKHFIRSGGFEPGERITEAKAAKCLDMPRAPIRESLLRLEAEGVIKGRGPHRGRFVSHIEDMKKEEVLHRYTMREIVEGMAARLAALHMTGIQINELREKVRELAEAIKTNDKERRYKASLEFNEYLIKNCGNPLLYQTWEYHQLMPVQVRSDSFSARIKGNLPPHDVTGESLLEIVEAIASHDPDKAELLMREYIRRITKVIHDASW